MLKPVRDKILILPEKNPMISSGGIHLPERLEGKSCKGRVVSIGPEVRVVEIGDIVLFNAMGSTELKDNEVKYVLVREELIYAKEVE